ncbi:MAG: sulfotransferase domain-containing protein [Actinomycetota bacterium]|nr:sulfotransferase domain-containing protein [Actinomycetota bacterium]
MTGSPATRSAPVVLVRTAAKKGARAYGMATSAVRAQPDFVIIGGKRCGTTSLFRNLSTHPSYVPLFPARQQIKGAHFFDTNYSRGMTWYRSHFPVRARLRSARGGPSPRITGEASPYYLFHPHAGARAARGIPQAKLIVLLRNPVDRAYSHYRERVRHQVETLSFEEALESEDRRLAGEEERMLADETYVSFAHEHLSYVRQGLYARALRRWLEVFSREQFLFVVSEDLFRDPKEAYGRVTRFLGVESLPLKTFEKFNWHPGSPMAKETRSFLEDRFRGPNAELESLLEMDFSAWA